MLVLGSSLLAKFYQFAKAYKTGTTVQTTTWQTYNYDVEVTDTDGIWDGSISKFGPVTGDGIIMVWKTYERPAGGQDTWLRTLTAMTVNGTAVNTGDYFGQDGAKWGAIPFTDMGMKRILNGDYIVVQHWMDTSYTLTGGDVNNVRVLFIPDGAEEGAIDIQRYGLATSQAVVSDASWNKLTGWDRSLYGDGSWVDGSGEEWTMPADGYLLTHLHIRDHSEINSQSNYVLVRVKVDGATTSYDVYSNPVRYTGRPQWFDMVTPVSAGDVISYEMRFISFDASQTYTIRGYDDSGSEDQCHMTMTLIA